MVAALTILLAVAITFYAFSGRQVPFVHHFTLHALVRNSVDIIPNSPVRIAGIDVGRVTGTSAEGNLTRINFTMQSNGMPVHKDATVAIRDRLFLEGGYYLQLNPGSPSAPAAPDGFTIPTSNTSYPVQFYQLLSTFDLATRHSLETTLATLNEGLSAPDGEPPTASNSGAGGLKQAAPQFTPTLKDIGWTAQGLRGTAPGDVQRLLASTSNVTATLQGSSPQLADLVTNLNHASSALAASDGALAQSVSGIDQTLKAAPRALTAVDRSLPPLASLAVALQPSLQVAPPLIDGLIKAVGQLAAVVAPVERGRLLQTLKATFVQFPTTLRQLGSVFPVGKAVTDCLRTHVNPVLTSVAPDGSLSSGRPVWQDFAHFIVSLSSAVQNFDANGYWIRLIGGTGTNGLSVGQIPLIGQVLGSTPGTSGIVGARPQWVGDLPSSAFRPDVPCSSQPVVGLSATSAAPDLRHVGWASQPTPDITARLARLLGLKTGVARGGQGGGGGNAAAPSGGSH